MNHHSTERLLCVVLDFGRTDVLFTEERTGGEARVGVPPAGVDRTVSRIRDTCNFFFTVGKIPHTFIF
jgi:hypothetical protein